MSLCYNLLSRFRAWIETHKNFSKVSREKNALDERVFFDVINSETSIRIF